MFSKGTCARVSGSVARLSRISTSFSEMHSAKAAEAEIVDHVWRDHPERRRRKLLERSRFVTIPFVARSLARSHARSFVREGLRCACAISNPIRGLLPVPLSPRPSANPRGTRASVGARSASPNEIAPSSFSPSVYSSSLLHPVLGPGAESWVPAMAGGMTADECRARPNRAQDERTKTSGQL